MNSPIKGLYIWAFLVVVLVAIFLVLQILGVVATRGAYKNPASLLTTPEISRLA